MNWQVIGAGVIGGGLVCVGGLVSGALRAGGSAEVFETTTFAHEFPDTDVWLTDPEQYEHTYWAYGDVDGDGRIDCVWSAAPSTAAAGELPAVVLVGLGQGDGTFTIVQDIELWEDLSQWDGWYVGSIKLLDVNGDGWLDVVAHETWWNCLDMDCNERDEHEAIRVLLNAQGSGFRCAGDVDGNRRTDVYDVLDVLEDWGCRSDDG